MKKLLLILIIITPFISRAQTDTTNFTWEYIKSFQGTKHDLYLKARDWAFTILKNPKAAIQIQDSSEGKILIHTDFQTMTSKYPGTIYCDLEVDVKANKYRFKAYNYLYAMDQDKNGTPGIDKFPLSIKGFPFKIPYVRKFKADDVWLQIKNDAIIMTNTLYENLIKEFNLKQNNW